MKRATATVHPNCQLPLLRLSRGSNTYRLLSTSPVSLRKYTKATQQDIGPLKSSGWQESSSGLALSKTYQFGSFTDSWAFLTKVAMHSHLKGHHPKIENIYTTVTIKLETHDIGCISTADTLMASKFDSWSN